MKIYEERKNLEAEIIYVGTAAPGCPAAPML
jgi:hypothetical protein